MIVMLGEGAHIIIKGILYELDFDPILGVIMSYTQRDVKCTYVSQQVLIAQQP